MKKILFFAAFAALFSSCSKEFVESDTATPDSRAGREVTASISAEAPAETRAGYDPGDNSTLTFKWHDNDSISVIVPSVAGNTNRKFITAKGGPSATFSGTITSWETEQTVYGVYPYTTTATVSADGKISASLSSVQNFKAGASRQNMLMFASYEAPTQDDIRFAFKQGAATLRLVIENVPAGKTVETVTVSNKDAEAIFPTTADFDPATGEASTPSNYVSSIITRVENATAGAATTVDVGLLPCDLSGKTLTFKVRMASGEVYTLEKPGRKFERNVHVKLAVDCGTITPAVSNSMKFTIDTRKGTQGNSFILPMKVGSANLSTLTVDWGDNGQQTVFAAQEAPTLEKLTHVYTDPGQYKITITSSQADASKAQIPSFSFSSNTTDNNKLKLISLDTPLLRVNTTSNLNIFNGCANLVSIPSDLFINNPQVMSFSSCFKGCSSLASIPAELFANNPKATSFESCFYSWSKITSIPAELFANNPEATSFSNCFNGCSQLTGSIPAGLFANNPKVTSFSNCFNGCSQLTGIPAGLFANNPEVTDFSRCFHSCSGMTGEIPAELFAKNTLVENFSYCFCACSKITSIPAGLFANNPKATSFSYCFSNCSKLTGEIPAGLFDENALVENFSYCFSNCSRLTGSIPAGLFANNPKATSFSYCFSNCSQLTGEIPAGLFVKNTLATDFSFCFFSCSQLTGSIPAGLFNENTLVQNFSGCFYGCKELTGAIPAGLFAKNLLATDFSYCFGNCWNLKLNPDIFCNEAAESGTRFAGKTMNFTECFNSIGWLLEAGSAGQTPALWTYTYDTVTSTDCFKDASMLSNWNDIPTTWGGPKVVQ